MNKKYIHNNLAVSASPNIVTPLLNKSGELESKTSAVFIYFEEDKMDIYRLSTKAKPKWSREIYKFSDRKMISKDTKKYDKPPLVPDGAYTVRIRNIEFSATVSMDINQLTELVDTFNLE